MLTFITSLFTNAVFKWLLRRILELGGMIFTFTGSAIGLFQMLPPDAQHTVYLVLTSNFDSLSVTALWGLLATIVGLIWNARSTFKAKPELPVLSVDEALAVAEKQTGVKHTFDGKR
jgi:hypothetical protein